MRLRHYHQRHHECALAALCTLTGTDYETASDLFELEHGAPWGMFATQGTENWINFVRKYLLINTNVLSFRLADRGQVCGIEVKGPALLIVSFSYSSHAVVLDSDDCVYDSACADVIPLKHYRQYLTLRDGWIADCIPAERIRGKQ